MIPEKDYVMKYVMAKHPEATKKLLQSEDLMDIYDDPIISTCLIIQKKCPWYTKSPEMVDLYNICKMN